MFRIGKAGQALAMGAIADLVVILDEGDERLRRQARCDLAAHAFEIARVVALVGKPFGQAAAETLDRVAAEIAIIAFGLAGQQPVPTMVDVVVPLGIEGQSLLVVASSCQTRCLVVFVFQNEMNVAIRQGRPDTLGHFLQKVQVAVVLDRVDRVETQAVHVKLLQPVERVLDEELPDHVA